MLLKQQDDIGVTVQCDILWDTHKAQISLGCIIIEGKGVNTGLGKNLQVNIMVYSSFAGGRNPFQATKEAPGAPTQPLAICGPPVVALYSSEGHQNNPLTPSQLCCPRSIGSFMSWKCLSCLTGWDLPLQQGIFFSGCFSESSSVGPLPCARDYSCVMSHAGRGPHYHLRSECARPHLSEITPGPPGSVRISWGADTRMGVRVQELYWEK